MKGDFVLKKTIIYVGGFELPDKNAAAHRVLSNAKIFRDLGYDVLFIDVDKSLNFNSNILETEKDAQGFKCWSVPYPKSNCEWLNYLTSIRHVETIVEQNQSVLAVVAYNYPAFALNKMKIFCKKRNLRIFADVTEWYSTKGTNIVFKIIKGLDSFFRMRILQKRMDGLIVISRYLENYYKNCRNVVRIPPLVDLNEEKWKSPIPERNDNKIRFIYSGSPGKNKDKVNLLIEAVGELNSFENFILNVAGIEKDQYLTFYPHHQELLEILKEKVFFHGKLTHLQSLELLRNSDFSVFFRDDNITTKAGFPTKFVESISAGIPVITNKSSDLDEYLIEGKNGFAVKENIAKVIENIVKTDSASEELKKSVNRKIFNYSNYIKLVEQFLKNGIN